MIDYSKAIAAMRPPDPGPALARAFAKAARDGDLQSLVNILGAADHACALDKALRACSRVSVHPRVRRHFLQMWPRIGDAMRSNTNDDLALINAARALLPPYAGSARVLYRGDSYFNRRRRSYGLSWSARRYVAEGFAQGMWQTYVEGSVLLRVTAGPEAIIAVVGNTRGEHEYLVDRRKLKNVLVLKKYPHKPLLPTERPVEP